MAMSDLGGWDSGDQPAGVLSQLNGKPLKLVDQFTYLGSNISSTESHVNICLDKI